MENIFTLDNILGGLINSFAHIYIWSKLFNEKIDFKNIRYYIIQILFSLMLLLNYILTNDLLKIVVLIIFMIMFCYFLFKKKFVNCILAAFISQIIMMASEVIFALIVTVILGMDVNNIVNFFVGKIIGNVSISIIAILLCRLKFIKKLYNSLNKTISNLKSTQLFVISIIILISINFIFLPIYYDYNVVYILFINTLISVCYLIICFKFLKAQNNYNKINSKYSTTINSLKEYEEILDVYRVSSHENKNELLTIRSMIVKKEKNIPEYIDKIIDNKIKDDEKLMFDTNTIPAGGLRAVIYSKMLYMKENKINFKLSVDRKVRTVELINLGEDLMLDICKIIGVFLDNAIEAVEKLKKKNIVIKLYTDDECFNIEVSNNFEGTIDIDKISDKGYTTKESGHGYGLSLVKEIINKNDKLTNIKRIDKNIFVQKLSIKLK